MRGEELTVSGALNLLSDRDRDMREAAGQAIGEAFGRNVRLFSLITNTLAKDKEIIDNWRRYPRPGSYRNRANMVEDEVVDALVSAVTDDYPRLSHRYYALKAKWLGLAKLQHWDRNAPLPGDDDRGDFLAGGARAGARRLCRLLARAGGGRAGASSTGPGSTPPCARASRAAPSPIPPCRRRIPICC